MARSATEGAQRTRHTAGSSSQEAAWTIAFDIHGNDLALQAELAAMSDDDRARTSPGWQHQGAFVASSRDFRSCTSRSSGTGASPDAK